MIRKRPAKKQKTDILIKFIFITETCLTKESIILKVGF